MADPGRDGSDLPGDQTGDRVDGRAVTDRGGDDRTGTGDDVEVDACRPQRHDDVGEEDGCVHPVAAHRLQGDLGEQLGVEAGLQHPAVDADRAVFRQRPPGLAHEPDGAAGRCGAGRGRDEGHTSHGARRLLRLHAPMVPRRTPVTLRRASCGHGTLRPTVLT